jgi:hypothetical protein
MCVRKREWIFVCVREREREREAWLRERKRKRADMFVREREDCRK